MVRNTKVVPYLDLPIQHCDDAVLKAMNRRGGRKEIEDAIARLRAAIPGITLRTTLIAGFPGETEEQYAELCDFVKTVRFDRLGCFAYSAEENTVAAKMPNRASFEWIGAYDITADELLAGTDTAKTESKTAQAQMLILELLADGKRMPSAELEKAVNERGISSRTMRTAKSRIGDRLVTEKDGTAWVCYLRD